MQYKILQTTSEEEFQFIYDEELNLYKHKGQPIIWIFWDDNPMPPYVRLSIETIHCHNNKSSNIILGNSTFVKDFLDPPEAFDYLIPAHKADYFRCAALLKFGGAYFDADTIMLKSIDNSFRKLKKIDILGYSWPPDGDAIGVGALGPMRANTLFMQKWKQQADKILNDRLHLLKAHQQNKSIPYPIEWAEILRNILLPTIKDVTENNGTIYEYIVGTDTFGQLITTGLNNHLAEVGVPETMRNSYRQLNLSVEYLMFTTQHYSPTQRQMPLIEFLEQKTILVDLLNFSLSRCKSAAD